jgi:SOS response regulatory protein OraA/RecX
MILVFRELLEKEAKGNFHVVNPGVIKHKTIIDLYKKYIDDSLEKNWIDESELVELGLATKKRSNNFLASPNLKKYGIEMRNIDVAMEELMQEYKQNLKK